MLKNVRLEGTEHATAVHIPRIDGVVGVQILGFARCAGERGATEGRRNGRRCRATELEGVASESEARLGVEARCVPLVVVMSNVLESVAAGGWVGVEIGFPPGSRVRSSSGRGRRGRMLRAQTRRQEVVVVRESRSQGIRAQTEAVHPRRQLPSVPPRVGRRVRERIDAPRIVRRVLLLRVTAWMLRRPVDRRKGRVHRTFTS